MRHRGWIGLAGVVALLATARPAVPEILAQALPVKYNLTVTSDIRIQNIGNYNDAVGGGTTNYTNTLTYTVVAQ